MKVETKVILEMQDEDGYNFVIRLNMEDAHELYSLLGEQLGLNFVKSDEPSVEFVPQEVKILERFGR